MTFMMRPSVSSPTGTEIGAPVSCHRLAAHQTFGGVHGDGAHGVLAEMLRDFENQAVAAVGGFERVQDGGRPPSNCTSTTAPMTWRNAAGPFAGLAAAAACCRLFGFLGLFFVSCFRDRRLERFGARNDFDEFLGDLRLTLAVVLERQLVDHVAGVARGVVHGAHLRALSRRVLEQRRGRSAPRCCAAAVARISFAPARIRRRRRRRPAPAFAAAIRRPG
jgi:hypothetical protein